MTAIYSDSFYNSIIGNIYIPNSVKTIEENAFYGVKDLNEIRCQIESKPESWTDN